MNINIQSNDQLEMTFNANVRCSSQDRRRQRRQRAAAWFQRMRQVVERAVDWTPAPEPRPEQIWFPEPATPRQSLTGTAAPIPFPAGATVSADDQMAA